MANFYGQYTGFGGGGEPIPEFIEATGGSVVTSGDYKIHTFNSSSSLVFLRPSILFL